MTRIWALAMLGVLCAGSMTMVRKISQLLPRPGAPPPQNLLSQLPPAALEMPPLPDVENLSGERPVLAPPQVDVVMNPIVKALLAAPRDGRPPSIVQKGKVRLLEAARLGRGIASRAAWFLAAMSALAAVFFMGGMIVPARVFAQMGHSLSRLWLVFLSVAAVGLFLVLRREPWSYLSMVFWAAPAAGLVGGAAVLRLIDFNYPFWNKSLVGLTAPLLSQALILAGAKLLKN